MVSVLPRPRPVTSGAAVPLPFPPPDGPAGPVKHRALSLPFLSLSLCMARALCVFLVVWIQVCTADSSSSIANYVPVELAVPAGQSSGKMQV